jgi:Glyoxalase-like domain
MALRRQGSLTVYFKIQVVIDAAEPAKLADFWAFALDYVLEPPPHGFETWEDFGRSIGMPEEEFGDQAAIIDPADEGPRVYFQRVPERKTAKNRVHLDVRVADREVEGEERKRLVSEKVEQLVEAGASFAWVNQDVRGHSIVLRDPEGNEFCVA